MSANGTHIGDQDAVKIAEWDADPEARGGPTFTNVEALLASLDDNGSDERSAAESGAITVLGSGLVTH